MRCATLPQCVQVGTIWFAPLVIRLAAFGISLAWGLCNADLFFLHLLAHKSVDWNLILVVGLVTFVISFFVLSFLGGVLLRCVVLGGRGVRAGMLACGHAGGRVRRWAGCVFVDTQCITWAVLLALSIK